MATCLTELFLWTLKGNLNIPSDLIGCHSYHDKNETGSNQQYYEERQQFTEGRDMIWAPKNKRPEKLRDNIKEMEELLTAFRVVRVRWRSRKVLQVILSNVTIINIVLAGHSGDVEKLLIDKSLVGKMSAETVSDVLMTDQFLVATYTDKARLDYVYFCKRPPLGEAIKKLEKVSAWEPKVTSIEIPGPVGRRLDRKLTVNLHQDLVLVWWSNSSKEAMPWSPMATDRDRANLIVISIHGPNIDVLTFARTECDPQSTSFSCIQPYKMFTVEQAMGSGGETTAKACTYEIVQNKIQRISVTNISLKSMVQCECRSPSEDKLLLGCADGTLVIYDEHKKVTPMTRAGIIPNMASWHPGGTLFFVASMRGDIQVFDFALSPLRIQLLSEEPNPHRILQTGKLFKVSPTLREIQWCVYDPQAADWCGDYTDALSLVYDKGPLGVLQLALGVVSRQRFSCVELVNEYIRAKQLEEAVSVLSVMNWDEDGSSCYTCLTAIVTHLLKLTLNAEREVQLETALGTFYAPKRALSEMTILDYRDPISRLARRFFHHLLRYARFDKAYLLAVDIGARDLFMDLHYMAQDKGETALAEVARRKAEHIDNESLDSFEDDAGGGESGFYHRHNGSSKPPGSNPASRHPEQIPVSRQHPWHHEKRSPRQPDGEVSGADESAPPLPARRTQQTTVGSTEVAPPPPRIRRVQYSDQQHVTNSISELDLDSDLISDYTAALNSNSAWDNSNNHANNGQEEEKTVKVFHFGVV